MPPVREQELSQAVPEEALRTTFLTAPQKNALREAVDAFWDDYGVQARRVPQPHLSARCSRRYARRRARAFHALTRCDCRVPRLDLARHKHSLQSARACAHRCWLVLRVAVRTGPPALRARLLDY